MLNTFTTYRRLIASLLAGWMTVIVISGIVFMHKEITSKGEIVTHIHPYDFRKKSPKHHHKSDAEIQFLNVLYQGSFVEPVFAALETPLFQEFEYLLYRPYYFSYYSYSPSHFYLRGPPSLT